MQNPLDGIIPDFTIFGAEFTALWQKLAAGGWGLAILICIAWLAHGLVGIASNRKGGHPGHLREATSEAKTAGFALGGVLALGTIVTVFINVFA